MSSKKSPKRIIETLSKCESIGGLDKSEERAKKYYMNLLNLREEFKNNFDKKILLNFLKALGNDERLMILDILKEKDRCVCELEAVLDKTQPAISHHLRILEEQGLIQGWKKGKFTHFSLIKPKFEEFKQLWQNWANKITNWLGPEIIR